MTRAAERYSLAVELVGDAEDLVRVAEVELEVASDPTMRDVRETELQAALQLQDEIAALVAPEMQRRREDLNARFWAVVAAAQEAPGSDWTMGHRRWMATDLKAEIVRRLGKRAYLSLPW